MCKQKKYALRKIAGYGLVSCAVGFVLMGTHSAYAEEDALDRMNTEIISKEVEKKNTDLSNEGISISEEYSDTDNVETNTDLSDENTDVSKTITGLSDEKTDVSEVHLDTDEVKATVTRTIYFKDKETNRDVAPPITQTIEVKQASTGNYYYFNHENKENTNNSMLPEVIVPQIKGYIPDREVVQAVDVSKNVYNRVGEFRPRIIDTQAIVYYTKVTPSYEQPSLDLRYTEDELKDKDKLVGIVNQYMYKYEPNGESHEENLTFSGFIYDVIEIEKVIGENYRLPMSYWGKGELMKLTRKINKPMKSLYKLIAFHRDCVPYVQPDFNYTLNQYYLDENGEKVPIFETPSTVSYHLDVNGLSADYHLKELTVTGKAEVGLGYHSFVKGVDQSNIEGVRYKIYPNTLIPKAFEYEGDLYVPMSNSIPLRDLCVDYAHGKMEIGRRDTYSTDVIYRKFPRSESLDELSNDSADTFIIVTNGFNTLWHTTHIPVVSHYSWDKEKGLRVTYELKDKDITQFSDEKVQFEEISFVDLDEEPSSYDKHTAKPTQAIKVKYKLFLDGNKYIQKEQIAQMNYDTADNAVFNISLGYLAIREEDAAIQDALTRHNEVVTQKFDYVKDITIKYDKDGKHLTEIPTAVRVALTQTNQYRFNGNALEKTLGEITPVGDVQQIGLKLQDLRILDIGTVCKEDKTVDLHVLDDYSGMDKEVILDKLNERIQPLLKQYSQVRVFLLIAKDRIHASNPAYINEFNSDYIVYPIILTSNEIPHSQIKMYTTTINYHIPKVVPNAEVDSEWQVELQDDFNFDNVVDEPTQTEKSEVKDSETQTDTPNISDSGVQTDNYLTNDASTQTDEPTKSDKDTQTDNQDTKDGDIQTNSLSLEEKKPDKTQDNKPNLLRNDKVQYTSSNREGSNLPQSGSKEQSTLGNLGVSALILGWIVRIFKRKKHTN